ncbi:MAG: hypothetical protein KUG75_02705 [Pseudomonadales bacterium]|nr:hypothetical protein [Pseudomonadales bacterium]
MLDSGTLIWFTAAAVCCFLFEKLTLVYALKRGLLSQPNERSSHTQPTPSVGGIAVIVPVLLFCAYQAAGDSVYVVLFFATLILAVVGIWDDLKPSSTLLRLLLQLPVVAASVYYLDLDTGFYIFGHLLHEGWLLTTILGLCVLWFINLFNFMDGIDGLAASQCVVYCLACLFLADDIPLSTFQLIGTVGICGLVFLCFNWPPAQIFMGDSGSLPVGYLLAIIALLLHQGGNLPIFSSLILLSVFWFDASFTLCRRMLTGQPFASAHRSHLYQKLSILYGHRRVSLLFLLYAMLVLLPLAGGATRYPAWGIMALSIACTPLLILSIKYAAGIPADTQ